MDPSPVPPVGAPTSRRWFSAISLAAVAGVAVGLLVVSGWRTNDGGQRRTGPDNEAAAVETRVAGISVERPGVGSDISSTSTPAVPDAAVPTAVSAVSPVAPAPTTSIPPARSLVSPQDSLRTQVLAAIAFPWQTALPGWRIEFLPARKGYRGSTFPDRQLIQIYQRDDLTLADYVHVTAHELGHAIDVTLLDDSDHERWNQTRGRAADADWWVASGADDFGSGAGDWAECFAWSQQPSGRFYSRVGAPPNDRQLQVMRDIIG